MRKPWVARMLARVLLCMTLKLLSRQPAFLTGGATTDN